MVSQSGSQRAARLAADPHVSYGLYTQDGLQYSLACWNVARQYSEAQKAGGEGRESSPDPKPQTKGTNLASRLRGPIFPHSTQPSLPLAGKDSTLP